MIEGEGTPEAVWQGWGRVFPPLSLAGCERMVVAAPHPDDEVLGVGGLVAHALRRGVDVTVVAVTDGTASHPGSPTTGPEDLARLRPAESDAALAELGFGGPVVRLGLPDGAVTAHEAVLADALAEVLGPSDAVATWVLATWRGDGHPDHEATGRAAATACERIGGRLLEYPVWTWHWATPDDPRVPWDRAAAVTLDAATREAKARAVERFTTQVRPLSPHPADAAVLGPHVLARLLRPDETVFR